MWILLKLRLMDWFFMTFEARIEQKGGKDSEYDDPD